MPATTNTRLLEWGQEWTEVHQRDDGHWWEGSDQE